MIGAQRVAQFNDLVFLLQRSGQAAYREVPYLAQYIVYEYGKAVAPYGVPSELSKQGTVRAFELRWLLTDART